MNQARFLVALAKRGIILHACELTKIGRNTVYDWRKDPAFEEKFLQACELAIERAEAELYRRGTEGWIEPVYQVGEHVGNIRKFSDTALLATLKARKPSLYKDRQEITGKDGEPLLPQTVADAEQLDDQQLVTILEALLTKAKATL